MIKEHSGIDFTKLLVSLSVGDESYYNEISDSTPLCQYLCRHPVYSDKNGKYSGIHISKELSDFVYKIDEIKQMGDDVHCCNNALDVVGFVNLRFDSLSTQLKYYDKLEDFISVNLR